MATTAVIACCSLARQPRHRVTAEVGSSTRRRLSFPVLPPFFRSIPRGDRARLSSGAIFRACSSSLAFPLRMQRAGRVGCVNVIASSEPRRERGDGHVHAGDRRRLVRSSTEEHYHGQLGTGFTAVSWSPVVRSL